jgi:hypothetical protein
LKQPGHVVVFAREEYASLLYAALSVPHLRVNNRREFARAISNRPSIAFVDVELLHQIESTTGVTVVGVTEGGVNDLVDRLLASPSLLRLISVSLLSGPSATANLAALCERIQRGPEHSAITDADVGRCALLSSSERRGARLERMADFFAAQSVHKKTIEMISDVAEELITNAIYDAPHEAGWFEAPVERTTAIELPPQLACEISYGIERNNVFVRVRDPFGALRQERLMQVLQRCRGSEVEVDGSRGGAGLGMWRVFSAASTLIVSVIPARLTDITVWIDANNRRPSGKLHTLQMTFTERFDIDTVAGRFAADHDFDLMDDSFTALIS